MSSGNIKSNSTTKRMDSNRVRLYTGESQRPNGTYMYRWTDAQGKRHYIYAPTLEKLREEEKLIIVDEHDGIKQENKLLTLNDLFELWKDTKRGIKDSTFQNYIYMYNLIVAPNFGKNRVQMIKKSDVKKFYNRLADGKRMCYVYFDIKPEFGYYIPENAPVKVILPAGYRANGIFDTAETYSTVYKGDWISYSPINQKYRVSQLLEPNSEGKEYGTDIRIQEPVVGDCPVTLAGYDKPLSLPQNMKVLSMQWLGPDNEPMRKFDKFELGKYYTLDLSIGFEGGEEKGYVFPKNWKEFKVNGKSVNAWMEYEDSTDGHVWHVYHPYKLVDPSAMGTVTGTVESYGDPDETITIQLVNSGNGEPEYITTVTGNSTEYSLTGVEPRSYVMRVEKNKHITEEFIMQVDPGNAVRDIQLNLLGDLNRNGKVDMADIVLLIRYQAGWSISIYEKAADINADSKISMADLVLLIREVL